MRLGLVGNRVRFYHYGLNMRRFQNSAGNSKFDLELWQFYLQAWFPHQSSLIFLDT